MTTEIDKVDWAILDSLADDYESLEQIVPAIQAVDPGAEETLVVERVGRLLVLELICVIGKSTPWYGMTSRGCEAWERHSATYSDAPPDWTGSWAMDLDYQTGTGYVNGVSREVCESAIAGHIGLENIIFDTTSFKHTAIDKWQAKYYKELEGGHRIDFRFKKKEA